MVIKNRFDKTHIVCYNISMSTANNKIRTNVYLDADIKKKAQEIYNRYKK